MERLVRAIETQRLVTGAHLPPSRSYARELGVSRNVVLSAYAQLEARGLVKGRQGAATVVRCSRPPAKARSGVQERPTPRFDFRFASVSQDERTQDHWIARVRHHAQRSLRRYADPQGLADLREQVAVFLARYRAIHVHPDHILLVSGSQQAIDLICRSFAEPGDLAWVESPAYQGAGAVMRLCRLKVKEARVDAQGLSVQELKRSRPGSLLFCTPSHQIPTGHLMSQQRREQLLTWANAQGVLILEDDYDGLPYYGKEQELTSLYAMAKPGRVLHVGTFSLLLFPGIRIGYVCASPEQIRTLTKSRWLAGRHNPELQQAALSDLMKSAQFDHHLARRRRALVAKRAALIAKIQACFGERALISGAHAGTFLVLQLRCRAPRALMKRLQNDPELGLEEIPKAGPDGARRRCLWLELCYSGLTVQQLQAGVERISGHLREVEST